MSILDVATLCACPCAGADRSQGVDMTKQTETPGVNLARRQLLRRIGLASGLAYVAPALTSLGIARASGGSGGSGPGGGSGPSGAGGFRSGGSGPSFSRPGGRRVRRVAPQRTVRAAPTPPPEMVMFLPDGTAIEPALAAGYRLIAQAPNAALAGSVLRLGLPAGRSPDAAQAELVQLIPGGGADENHLYRPDEFLCRDGSCAAHEMIGWSGWPSAFAPRIGMIDTGINVDHDALAGQRLTVHQADLGERDAAGRQHGTAIAAMLVGRIDDRVPGLLPNAELIAVEAFHRDARGEAADAFSLATAMDLLLSEEVSVINMSFSGPENAVLARLVERAASAGVGLVAAAGNGGPGAGPAYPAAWDGVIAVTAVDSRENPYRQANRGDYVAISAPGVNVWTAASISGGRLRSGTSYAAPFVSAALAVERMRMPAAPLSAVQERLLACARDLGVPGPDPVFGHGLLRAPGQCTAEDGAVFSVSGE
jgi:hypothetical protein